MMPHDAAHGAPERVARGPSPSHPLPRPAESREAREARERGDALLHALDRHAEALAGLERSRALLRLTRTMRIAIWAALVLYAALAAVVAVHLAR